MRLHIIQKQTMKDKNSTTDLFYYMNFLHLILHRKFIEPSIMRKGTEPTNMIHGMGIIHISCN